MAELLQYSFEVVGMANVERALASMERRFAQHNARMQREFGGGRSGRAPASGGLARDVAQSISAQEKAGLASARRLASAKDQLDRQRSRALTAAYNKQEREGIAAAKREASARLKFVQGTFGRGANRVISGVRAVGAAGLAMTGVGGAALAASAVNQAMKLDEISRRLAIQARNKGEEGANPDDLRKKFTQTGIKSGLAPEDVAAGVAKYVSITGDLNTAMEQRDTFAKTAQAAGASIEDVATVAANFSKLGIESLGDVQKSFASLTMQGKKGAFEIKDMATELPELLSQGATLGMKGVGGVRQMGGLMQVVQKATGNKDETSTAVANLFRMFISKDSKLESGAALGHRVSAFEDKGHTKFRGQNFGALIGETVDAARGDLTKLNEAFEIRGSKALNPFTTAYNTTREAALKGGDTDEVARQKGKAAAEAILSEATNVTDDFKEIERDATDAMKSFNVQMEIITTQLKDAMASELFPALKNLIPEITKLIGPTRTAATVMVKLAEALLDNPLKSLGAILAASVAYEVVKAKLGEVLSNGIKKMLELTGGGAGGPGGAPGGALGTKLGGMLGAAGTGAAIGISLGTAIFSAGVVNIETSEANMKKGGEDLNFVRNAGVDDIDEVRKKVKDQDERLFELKNPSLSQQASNLISYGSKTNDVEIKTQQNFDEEMTKRLEALEGFKDAADAITKSAMSSEDAAKAMQAAADHFHVQLPNRGNSPSPVKN